MVDDADNCGAGGLERADGGAGGRIFVLGGFVMGFGHSLVTDVVESYYLDRGGWRKEPALPVPLSGSRAETVQGSIYMMAGQDSRFLGKTLTDPSEPESPEEFVWPTLSTVLRLDASRGQWCPMPSMVHPRTCFGSAVVGGRIYVAGGFDGEKFVSGVECFDPRAPKWQLLPEFPHPRSAVAMSAVEAGGGGYLVACGGMKIPGGISDVVDIFDVRKGAWVSGPALLGGRSGAAAASVRNKLYIMGGVSANGPLAGVDVFDIRTLSWERDLSDAMDQPRTSLAAVASGDTIVAMGGYDGDGLPVDTVEIYSPGDGEGGGWRKGRSLSFARGMLAAALSPPQQ